MSSLTINQSVNTIFLPYEYDRSIDFVLLSYLMSLGVGDATFFLLLVKYQSTQ
jgi:hypothetical protein